MPIAVLFKFPGAASRAKYQKSVRMILKGRRKRLADWPVKGCLAHIAGPVPGGLVRGRCVAIACRLQPLWQEA
jgi:hypothetical protein